MHSLVESKFRANCVCKVTSVKSCSCQKSELCVKSNSFRVLLDNSGHC